MKNSRQIFKNIFDQEIDPAFAQRSEYIIDKLHKIKAHKVLDAGCGRGYYVKLISMLPHTKKVIGIDINNNYLKRAHETIRGESKATVISGSIYSLPFARSTFDAVVCSEILEHLNADKKALAELRRVLKPGGSLLISVPHQNFPFLWDPINWTLMKFFNTHMNPDRWWIAGIWADHVRLYTKKELLSKIENSGFVVLNNEDVVMWSWPFSHFLLYGIGKNLVERFGTSGFDRFNIDASKPLSKFLASFMRFPSHLLDKKIPTKTSTNLVVHAIK